MPLELATVPLGSTCTECKREVAPEAAFVDEDKLYCGSCAPKGSVPARVELSEASAVQPLVPGQKLDKAETIRNFVFDLLGLKKS